MSSCGLSCAFTAWKSRLKQDRYLRPVTRSSDQGTLCSMSLTMFACAKKSERLSTAKFLRCLFLGVIRYECMRPSYSPRREEVSVGMGTLTCPLYVSVSWGWSMAMPKVVDRFLTEPSLALACVVVGGASATIGTGVIVCLWLLQVWHVQVSGTLVRLTHVRWNQPSCVSH